MGKKGKLMTHVRGEDTTSASLKIYFSGELVDLLGIYFILFIYDNHTTEKDV